ncbi:Protein binding transcription factor zinc ion binding [Musa troglodytarum]|uniref:Protein binding transcription factor zinc ion binding n=1 Tax=Musa troglodytarum TaxID=320322 RepID=A0A9E7HD09_9LILI|nr:Protein binding transcription factor zinc ion binding [Musa troglodytarum]
MASTTLSTAAAPSQLSSGKNGIFSPSRALLSKPARGLGLGKERSGKITCQATSIPADRVPDMGKRQLLNLLLLGAVSLPTVGMLIPYTYFFVPPGSGGAGGGTIAKDALGNDVTLDGWLKTHGPGDRTLAQGLKLGSTE